MTRQYTNWLFLSNGKVKKKKYIFARYYQIRASIEERVKAQSLKSDYLGLYLMFTVYFLCNFKHGILSLLRFSHL